MQANRLHALRWGVAALFAAILADLAEDLVDPTGSGEAAQVFDAAAQHHGRMIASAIFLLASAFIVPAVFGLVRTLEDRGRRIGLVAAGLALLGALGHAALAALYLVWAALPGADASRAQLIGVIDRVNESGWAAILLPLIIAFPLSMVAVFVAMVRGRIAPSWVIVPVLAAPVVAIVGPGSDTAKTAAALVLFLIATCGLATRAFRPTPSERTPAESAPAPV